MERPIAWMGVGLSPGNDLPWGKCLLNCAPGMGLMAGRGVVNHAPAGYCFGMVDDRAKPRRLRPGFARGVQGDSSPPPEGGGKAP